MEYALIIPIDISEILDWITVVLYAKQIPSESARDTYMEKEHDE